MRISPSFRKVDEEFHPAKSGGVHIIRIERLRDHFFKAGNYNLTQNKYSARGLSLVSTEGDRAHPYFLKAIGMKIVIHLYRYI